MPWKKGESGNLAGRPRKTPLTDEIRDFGSKNGNFKKVVRALFARAFDGDLKAISIIFDRVEGRPRQYVEIAADQGGPGIQQILAKMAGEIVRANDDRGSDSENDGTDDDPE